MKVVILAGGVGSRLQEETGVKPKPMVEIGGRPILWHIMKYFAHYGHTEFILALGYKGEAIKNYFLNYRALQGDLTIDLSKGGARVQRKDLEDWTVHLVDTGASTETGGRVKRLKAWLGKEPFFLTYGDGVSNVDLDRLAAFHRKHGKLATVTAVRPPARFGGIVFDGDRVKEFTEKPQIGEGWINGGFFVLDPRVLRTIGGDSTIWERAPLETLARKGQLMAYRHDGFWQCMDTVREVRVLESLWTSGDAPWKVW